MTPEQLESINALIEANRVGCHRRGCSAAATTVHYRAQVNAHGGLSTFRFQRCESHPLKSADWSEPFVASPRAPLHPEDQK